MRKTISLILVMFMMLLIPTAAFADTEITVVGTGEILVPADVAVVTLGVSAADRDVLTAQAKVNETIAKVRKALIAAGVHEEDISTDYINIYAMYDYSDSKEELTAYNANSTLAVRVSDMDEVGNVIDTAFEAGANTLNGIQFSATNTTEAKEKALKAAMKDAKEKAEVLAEASGLQIREMDEIVEQSTYSYDRGVANNFAKAESADAAGTFVQAAKLTVSSTISVKFKAA